LIFIGFCWRDTRIQGQHASLHPANPSPPAWLIPLLGHLRRLQLQNPPPKTPQNPVRDTKTRQRTRFHCIRLLQQLLNYIFADAESGETFYFLMCYR